MTNVSGRTTCLRSHFNCSSLVLWSLLAFLIPGVTPYARASFSLTFQGYVRDINTAGAVSLSSPSGVVVDAAGNVYICDTGNNRIVEFDIHGVATVVPISGLSPALSSPSSIATDAAGNLYIADTGNSRIVEVSPLGFGSIVSTGSNSLVSPRGVTMDTSGDLFIADTGNNRIVEVLAGGAAAALTITVTSGASTLSSPKGLAVNAAGTLYVADSGNNRIVKVASGSTTGVVASIVGGVTLSSPNAVSVDRIGNVMIADSANDRIAEIDTSGNGTVLYTGSNSLTGPLAAAVDAFGTIYIADTGDSRVLIVNPPINAGLNPGNSTYSLNQSTVGFGHIQLGSSRAISVTMEFTTGSVGLGAVKILTAGTENLDFTSASGTTCSGSTTANQACFVQVSFLPTAPGLRSGAVVLYDTALNPILTVPMYGFGDAPIAALSSNYGSVLGTGSLVTSNPYQVALDGSGNIYIGDYSGSNVTKIPAGGGSPTVVPLGMPGSTAVQNIAGVAVDGAGNLFVADHQNNRILVMTPGGIASVLTINGLSQSLSLPTALNFDAAGNLYVTDFANGRLVEISSVVVAGSTSSGLGTVIGTGSYSFPGNTLTGMAVDSLGTVYLAARTQNSSSIVKVTNSGVASTVSIPGNITPAIGNPQGVAVDPMGNLYIVDTANRRIVEITTAGVASAIQISGLSSPSTLGGLIFGVTADAYGNLYIADWTNNRVVYVDVSGASLSYLSTNVGSTSSDSPQTATLTNLGNLPLVLSADPAFTADFTANTADSNSCTSSTSLSTGTVCDVSIKFTPQSSGSLSAGITVTNNNLNAPGSTQQIDVSGIGINPGDTTAATVTISPTSIVNGQTATIAATVTDTTAGHTTHISTGSLSFTDTVGSTVTSLNGGAAVNLTSTGTATLTGVQLSGIGSHTISANYAGVANTFLASSNSMTATLSKAMAGVTGPATQPVALTPGQTASAIVTVTGPYLTIAAPTGALSYTLLDASNATIASGTPTLTAGSNSSAASIPIPGTLPSGSYSIEVSYSGDGNYVAAFNPTNIVLVIAQITSTVTWHPAAPLISYGTTLAGILDATSSAGSSAVPGTFAYTAALAGGSPVPVTSATFLGVGSYILSATFTPTDMVTYTVAVSTAPLVVTKAAATSALTLTPATVLTTSAVVLTASVTSPSGMPSGTVSFSDGTTPLATKALSDGGASYSAPAFAAGKHTITVTYSGDGSFGISTGSASFTVNKVVPTLTVNTSLNPILIGNSVTFTATILSTSGTPIGLVMFYDGTTLLGSGVPAAGVVTYSTASLIAETHEITAVYHGDGTFATSTSAPLTQAIQDFGITIPATGTNSETVSQGGTATYSLAIGPENATTLPSPVTLSVSGVPPGATATLSPQVLPAGSPLTNVTLSIALPAMTASTHRQEYLLKGFGSVALGMLILPFTARFRRSVRRPGRMAGVLLFVVIGASAVLGLTGCGTAGGFFGHQPHSYDVIVTATSGTASHTATVTLIVQGN